jgi:hypothetical protein
MCTRVATSSGPLCEEGASKSIQAPPVLRERIVTTLSLRGQIAQLSLDAH